MHAVARARLPGPPSTRRIEHGFGVVLMQQEPAISVVNLGGKILFSVRCRPQKRPAKWRAPEIEYTVDLVDGFRVNDIFLDRLHVRGNLDLTWLQGFGYLTLKLNVQHAIGMGRTDHLNMIR